MKIDWNYINSQRYYNTHKVKTPKLTYTFKSLWNGHYVSVSQFSRSVMSNSLQPHGQQHTRLPCPSPIPRACSSSRPLSQWCHPTIWQMLGCSNKSSTNDLALMELRVKTSVAHVLGIVLKFIFSKSYFRNKMKSLVLHCGGRDYIRE